MPVQMDEEVLRRARESLARKQKKMSFVAEIMGGQWDYTPAMRKEKGTLAAQPDRRIYDDNLVAWLQGLSDHSDGAEYDTLQMLISMVENGEHIEEPVEVDPNWTPPPPDVACPF